MTEVPICVGESRRRGGNRVAFVKALLTFASRCEDATIKLCNTRGLRLPWSSKDPENGAPGSSERTADLCRPMTDNYWSL
jgi:hypothetical protein